MAEWPKAGEQHMLPLILPMIYYNTKLKKQEHLHHKKVLKDKSQELYISYKRKKKTTNVRDESGS